MGAVLAARHGRAGTVDWQQGPSHGGWAHRALGVAGEIGLKLAQLIQHRPEVADAGGDQPAHVGDRLAHRLLVLEQGIGVDDLLHTLDDLGLTIDAMLPGQAEHIGEVLASAIFGPPRRDRTQSPLRWVTVHETTPC
jgi:hypothetical protein